MPAKSKAQQMAAGAALSGKRGDTEVSELKGASKQMYQSMSEEELEDLADVAGPQFVALPDGTPGPSLACAVIVKTVDAQTRAKTAINDLLRD